MGTADSRWVKQEEHHLQDKNIISTRQDLINVSALAMFRK